MQVGARRSVEPFWPCCTGRSICKRRSLRVRGTGRL
nr:MAG TPA: hypothetical protein [Caudoviricetes sp.]